MNWENISKDTKLIDLLKERVKLEEKIRLLDPNALILYELENLYEGK